MQLPRDTASLFILRLQQSAGQRPVARLALAERLLRTPVPRNIACGTNHAMRTPSGGSQNRATQEQPNDLPVVGNEAAFNLGGMGIPLYIVGVGAYLERGGFTRAHVLPVVRVDTLEPTVAP